MADVVTDQVAQKRKMPVSPFIILAVATIFIIWLVALFMNKDIYDNYGMNLSREYWLYISYAVMIVFIIILMVFSFPSRAPAPQPVPSQAQMVPIPAAAAPAGQGIVVTGVEPAVAEMSVMETEPLVVEAEIVEAEPIEEEEEAPPKELKTKKPRLVEYPKKVPGGVYGDTIIRVDPRTKLNLRTLLVRSCMICDRQGKCWEEIKDTISRDDFLGNIECKKGLRRIKSPEVEKEPSKKKRKKMVMKVKPKSEPKEEGS